MAGRPKRRARLKREEAERARLNPLDARDRMRRAMYPDPQAPYIVMVDRRKTYEYARYGNAINRAEKEARTAKEVVLTQGGQVVRVWGEGTRRNPTEAECDARVQRALARKDKKRRVKPSPWESPLDFPAMLNPRRAMTREERAEVVAVREALLRLSDTMWDNPAFSDEDMSQLGSAHSWLGYMLERPLE